MQPAAVDLTNCESEPIHLLGGIQPIGFLVALAPDWTVSRMSANCSEHVGRPPEELLGAEARELLPSETIHALRNRMTLLRGADATERMLGVAVEGSETPFDIAIHMAGDEVVLEAEPSRTRQPGDAATIVRAMIARLEPAAAMEGLLSEGARQIRVLTGFDRVMVYRFAADGHGEVVAESARPGVDSFLGLHFPATDIPRQARELYRRNLLRLIADVDAEPVPVLPGSGQPLDLSLSTLRSVSRIHIEYLKNMEVGASMSISIIVGGKLWGLLACHHRAARCPGLETRSIAELFAQMFGMRIEMLEQKAALEFELRARAAADRLIADAEAEGDPLADVEQVLTTLSAAVPCEGLAVVRSGAADIAGLAPPPEEALQIAAGIERVAGGRAFAAERLADVVPDAMADIAGVLGIPVSKSGDWLLLFRPEQLQAIRWAGNPDKPVDASDPGRLTPRHSFAEFQELVRGRSAPFTAAELAAAESLRTTLVPALRRLRGEDAAGRSATNDRQALVIAELNHRVRNILGLVRGLIRQSRPGDGDGVEDFVALLDRRIQALARAHNQMTQDQAGPTPLRTLIEAETTAYASERLGRIAVAGPAVTVSSHAWPIMALLLHELVTNSVKYGALSGEGAVSISWTRDERGDLFLQWRESGGPPVEPPHRRGFGTTIIERSIPHDLGGEARVAYERAGLEADFRIPALHVGDPAQAPAADAAPAPDAEARGREAVRGASVLLVEDSLIIALDTEELLTRLGAGHVVAVNTVEAAIEAIKADPPTLALLDVNLGGETSYPVADLLAARGIPFLFASGYGDHGRAGQAYADRPVVQKPYTLETLARAFGALAPRG